MRTNVCMTLVAGIADAPAPDAVAVAGRAALVAEETDVARPVMVAKRLHERGERQQRRHEITTTRARSEPGHTAIAVRTLHLHHRRPWWRMRSVH